eukprot:COSAG01_NODE_36015_length_523_cov_3.044811_1_plen_69_part_00
MLLAVCMIVAVSTEHSASQHHGKHGYFNTSAWMMRGLCGETQAQIYEICPYYAPVVMIEVRLSENEDL